MKSNIKKLFQKTLNIQSIFNESEKLIPSSNKESFSKKSHLDEFREQCSNICIFPLGIRENYSGNYSKYLF